MDETTKEHLRNHWITRAMRRSRETFIASGRKDPMFLVIDAACMAVPLFADQPYFQRPTPERQVGGVIRYRPGTRDKILMTNVFDPSSQRVVRIIVCDVAALVDGLGRLISDIGCDSREAEELLDKVRRWVTHDDTLDDDTPDDVSWAQQLKVRNEIS